MRPSPPQQNADISQDRRDDTLGGPLAGARPRAFAAEATSAGEQQIENAEGGLIRGVLFDIDGTLYHQTPVRIVMALLLVVCNIHDPLGLVRKIKVIKAYREAQEVLRGSTDAADSNPNQITLTASQTGESIAYTRAVVAEWFERRPLPVLYVLRRRNLRKTLQLLVDRGLRLGVYSDYPVHDKLRALRITDLISVAVSSSDPEVQSFKPHQKGFWVAAKKMNLRPSEIIYVGDRTEVDAVGGHAAGMRVIIIKGLRSTSVSSSNCRHCASLSDILQHVGMQSSPRRMTATPNEES